MFDLGQIFNKFVTTLSFYTEMSCKGKYVFPKK